MGIGCWSRFTRTAVIIVLWPYKSFSWTKLNEQREENLLILLCAGSISKDVKIWESCSYRILFQPILAVCRWNNILSNPNPDRIIIQPTYFEIEIYDIIQKKNSKRRNLLYLESYLQIPNKKEETKIMIGLDSAI